MEALFQTLNDPNVLIQKDAIHSLVNLSSDDVFNHITLEQYNIIPTLIRCITVARSPFADKVFYFQHAYANHNLGLVDPIKYDKK